jgi:DNA-directed RNA polymerase specialized sigma24 family protein
MEHRLEFPSTHWSTVWATQELNTEEANAALGRFFERYQPPLLAYLRQKFLCDEDQAQDWLQQFMVEQVLRKELLHSARPIQGKRFRSFLLCTLHHFVTSQIRREQSQKRAPVGGWSPMESFLEFEAAATHDPVSDAFDLAWARHVVSTALDLMKKHCEKENRLDVWGVFEGRVRGPILEGTEPIAYGRLVEQFELESPIQAHNVLATGKRLFARCLRNVIAEYASTETEVEEELKGLMRVLSR